MTGHRFIVGVVLMLVIPVSDVPAQPTVSVRDSTIRGVKFSDVVAGDLLGSGQNDLFILGELRDGVAVSSIYEFQNRTFDPVVQPPFVGASFDEQLDIPLLDFSYGAAALADLDGNGEQDIILSGRIQVDNNTYGALSGVYFNFSAASETPTFEWRDAIGLPWVGSSEVETADFDGDGVPDIAIGGAEPDGTVIFGVYLNRLSTTGRFVRMPSQFPAILPTMLSAGDFDGDGDEDLIVGGRLGGEKHVVRLFENTEDGLVVRPTSLPDLHFPGGEFADIDGDGDDDLLLTGGEYSPNILTGRSTLYISENGSFSPSGTNFPGVFYGEVGFADFEGDGDLDLFIEGLTDPTDRTGTRLFIFRNGNGVFQQVADERSLVFGGAAWVDYDSNGRMDIIVTGENNDEHQVLIYEFGPRATPPPPSD